MLTHRNLYNMTMSFLADIGPVDETDASLYPAPLSHGAGLLALAHLVRGATNVVPESGGFQPDEIVDLVNYFPGSSFFAAPTMVNRLVTSPSMADLKVENLDHIFYGGAPMYVEDLKRALSALGPRLWQTYGQGESPCTISYLPPYMHLDNGDGRGVNHFTQAIAVEYAPKGILCNAVLPGLINTPMIVAPYKYVYDSVDDMIAKRDAMVPMGKMGTAWDVAHASLFLASDEAEIHLRRASSCRWCAHVPNWLTRLSGNVS
ncbi:SDR family oxidoreductase [Bradyrhizobium sp. INPA01-394B]|jgi:acyl-CoA synthetase (AMP-forming)/AMP-acid ligase II|uniref:SDR family oxidoreductase n=2 Tax=Bradyrhizobium campsiandrae TaxID=1729892 RepID=A0ABR7U644_9BRAD|nr:SDR family oxidoreductase [Bradyrhizobium campsiandrae]MBC9978991.1 SDR family oxidoreductase [Bradyrhizobium campsiandrae]